MRVGRGKGGASPQSSNMVHRPRFNVVAISLTVVLLCGSATQLGSGVGVKERNAASLRRGESSSSSSLNAAGTATASSQSASSESGATSGGSIQYLSMLLEKFKNFALSAEQVSAHRHEAEDHRLSLAEGATYDANVKAALEESRTNNQA